MIFSRGTSYGLVEDIYERGVKLSYLNLCRVKTPYGITIGNATSIADTKKESIKKSYNEYLERFGMGCLLGKENQIFVIDLVQNKVVEDNESNYGYGDTYYGHSDTTGTASGQNSDFIISKSISELIEKNEVLCFWYGNKGKKVFMSEMIRKEILKRKLISSEVLLFAVSEISNYPTIIAVGIREKRIIATGVACSEDFMMSVKNALDELRIIEWQQYNNPKAHINHFSIDEQARMIRRIYEKKMLYNFVGENEYSKIEMLELTKWIENVYIKVIFSYEKYGIKTVKCVSKDLLAALPLKENIELDLSKSVVEKYYIHRDIDCPIA